MQSSVRSLAFKWDFQVCEVVHAMKSPVDEFRGRDDWALWSTVLKTPVNLALICFPEWRTCTSAQPSLNREKESGALGCWTKAHCPRGWGHPRVRLSNSPPWKSHNVMPLTLCPFWSPSGPVPCPLSGSHPRNSPSPLQSHREDYDLLRPGTWWVCDLYLTLHPSQLWWRHTHMYMHTYIHKEVCECTPYTYEHTHINTQHEEIHAWLWRHTHMNPATLHHSREQERRGLLKMTLFLPFHHGCWCYRTRWRSSNCPPAEERDQAVPGKITQAPCCSHPAPPHSAAWTPFSIRESCLFHLWKGWYVLGTLPSILHTSPQCILTATQERSCPQHVIPACSLNCTGGLCPHSTLDTNSPERRPRGTAMF